MKISNVAGALLVAAPYMTTAWGFLPDEPPMLVKRSHPEVYKQGGVFGLTNEGLELFHGVKEKIRENPGHTESIINALQDKLLASLGAFQQKVDHDYTTVSTNSPRNTSPKYIKAITKEEAKSLEDWLNGLSHAHRRDEITKVTIGVRSRVTGRNYDGADDHRAVLHKYIGIIRGCPMFSSSEEEVSIPRGELDGNNWCQVAFGDVALKTKNTTGSLLSKFEELKQKFLHHLKAKRDRGFSFLDFGDPAHIEKREDFWTQVVEDPEKFKATDDTEVKTIEKGRTFEKRDGSMLGAAEKGIEKSLESQLKWMLEDIERDILFRFPYESDYKRKEAWEKFQEKKADLKHKYKLDNDSYSHDEKSVYKRDIWEDIEKMKTDFQDKLSFLDNGEEGIQKRDIWEEIEKMKQDLQDKMSSLDNGGEGIQKRDIWEEIEKMKQDLQDKMSSLDNGGEGIQKRDIWEEIEKMKQESQDKMSFLDQDEDEKREVQKREPQEDIDNDNDGEKEMQEKGIFDELEKINNRLLDRLREKQEEAEKLKEEFLDNFNQGMEDSNMELGALQKRGNFCSDRGDPWKSEEEDTPYAFRLPPKPKSDKPLDPQNRKKEKRAGWYPWCSDPVAEENPRIDIDLPANKDKADDTAPSGGFSDGIRDGFTNIGGKLEDTNIPSVEQNLSQRRK